jgi:DDE superfamily endonuclease
MIDGTLLPLATAPQRQDAPDYSGRKYNYSLSIIIINDDNRMIRYYLSGWPGSAHDSRIFSHTKVANEPEEYFSEHQYLLGDSAFESNWYMVVPYKCLPGMDLERDQEIFNTALSRPRIIGEHTIGLLKGRFPFFLYHYPWFHP